MKIQEINGDLILKDVDSFSLGDIFDCGQCFRWEKILPDTYEGVAFGRALRISRNENEVILHSTSREDFDKIWYRYFDFDTDYGRIKKKLSDDRVLKEAIGYGEGIRILCQDLWECVVSFIISASNNIPRIKKIIASLCENFGDEIIYEGKRYFTFPDPEKISSLTLDELSVIKAGFRDKYILSVAKSFAAGEIKAEDFAGLTTDEARERLKKLPGVGNKVADCILLFSLSKRDSFPVDVWVKRIMEYCYFGEETGIDEISRFAGEKFGELGGYAQQYLFFYARENKIGLKER